MSFLVVIPARYASTRLPGKPLLDLGGKPLVVRVAERAAASRAKRVLVATDDARIQAACRQAGLEVVMTRPDHPTGTDRLAEVCAHLALADAEIVVNVQGDEPFLPPEAIDHVADLLERHPDCAIATLAHPIHEEAELLNPNVVKCVRDERGEALYFSRAAIPHARDAWAQGASRQPAAGVHWRHLGLYAYRASFLRQFPSLSIPAIERLEALEQLRALAHGYRIAVGELDAALPPGIDTEEDYRRALTLWPADPGR